jgi:hypothetical protein
MAATSVPTRPRQDAADLDVRALHRHAVDAAIWGLPIVAFDAMRRAFFRDGDARYGDFVYLSRPPDARFQMPASDPSTLHVQSHFNTWASPLVIEVPPTREAGLCGAILDAWRVPLVDIGPDGEDEGDGASYLVLPPGYDRDVPLGYIPVRSETYNGFLQLDVSPTSSSEAHRLSAVALIHGLRWYALSQAGHPPEPRHVDVAGASFDVSVHYDDTFYDSLARILGEEPVLRCDLAATAHLRAIGISRRSRFEPGSGTRAVLRAAAAEVHAALAGAVAAGMRVFRDASWTGRSAAGVETSYRFRAGDDYFLEERAAATYRGDTPFRYAGASAAQFWSASDSEGQPLHGERSYRLRVPPRSDGGRSWNVCAYDLATCTFIRHSPRVAVDGRDDVARNEDGSVDVYFGPVPPEAGDRNWVATAPGTPWLAVFRVGRSGVMDRTWALPDLAPL